MGGYVLAKLEFYNQLLCFGLCLYAVNVWKTFYYHPVSRSSAVTRVCSGELNFSRTSPDIMKFFLYFTTARSSSDVYNVLGF